MCSPQENRGPRTGGFKRFLVWRSVHDHLSSVDSGKFDELRCHCIVSSVLTCLYTVSTRKEGQRPLCQSVVGGRETRKTSVVPKRASDSLLDDGSGPLIPANERRFRIDYASFDFNTNIETLTSSVLSSVLFDGGGCAWSNLNKI